MKAAWFSRHRPTPTQLEEIKKLTGAQLTEEEITEGMSMGSIDIQTDEDVVRAIKWMVQYEKVFGVFPVPILSRTYYGWPIHVELYGAWNIQRSVEGGKPTFEHKKFLKLSPTFV